VEIEKGEPQRLFPAGEAWHPLELREFFKIAEALSDPIRQWAYTVLGEGPMRQAELARKASEKFGRKITNILMSYHLRRLEEAGLIRFEMGFGNAKIVHRNLELKLEVKPLEEEVPHGGLEKELTEALRVLRAADTREKAKETLRHLRGRT
jgi:DNA-binding PadR family transcriptional regulator